MSLNFQSFSVTADEGFQRRLVYFTTGGDGKLSVVRKIIEQDLLHVDGCTVSGSVDPDDWMVSCTEQQYIYNKMLEVIDLLSD